MLNVDSNDNGEKKSTLTIAKKHLCTCSTLFLYISLPLLWQCQTSLMEKMSHVLTKNFVACVPVFFFFTATYIITLLAANFLFFSRPP